MQPESSLDRALRYTAMAICAVMFCGAVAFGWLAVLADEQRVRNHSTPILHNAAPQLRMAPSEPHESSAVVVSASRHFASGEQIPRP